MVHKKGQAGFSLVELMIVVGIIGVLAAMLTPKLQVFLSKGRQAEAKSNLASIYTSEVSYYSDSGNYAKINGLGPGGVCGDTSLGIDFGAACKTNLRYLYSVASTDTQKDFKADAKAAVVICNHSSASQAISDEWSLDQDKTMKAENDCTKY